MQSDLKWMVEQLKQSAITGASGGRSPRGLPPLEAHDSDSADFDRNFAELMSTVVTNPPGRLNLESP